MRRPIARVSASFATLAVVAAAFASTAAARDRVILERVTNVYPALPPGTYYPVAQGLFGADAGRAAPVYVYVAPEAPRGSVWWQSRPPVAPYGVYPNPWAHGPVGSVRSAPWMDYAARGAVGDPAVRGMAAMGCRGCLIVDAGAPVTVTRTFHRPRPKVVRQRPPIIPERPPRDIED